MFENFKAGDDVQEEKDSLGGGGVFESNIYPMTIDYAYLDKSKGGANSLVVRFSDVNGKRLNQSLWVTSGTAKGGANYYEDKQKNKVFLPGFLLANALCLLTVGKELYDMAQLAEEKTLMLYDFDAKAEVPTKVNAITELFGQEISVAVFKDIVDKNTDTGKVDAQGKKIYAPTGETREINEVDKFFRTSDSMTVAEIKGGATEAEFYASWKTLNEAKVRNKQVKGAAAGTPGKPAGAPKVASLFPG